MTEPNGQALEIALERYGDDLYRLAALLAHDASEAGAALQRAARHLATTPGTEPDERAVIAALEQALSPERGRRGRPPAWTIAQRDGDRRLLAAVARLPRPQRLALGLAALRSFEPLAAGYSPDTPALRRDALLALASAALPGEELPPMTGDEVPEEHRAARAALTLDDDVIHHDPLTRGHLALCAECRAAAVSWRALSTRVEEAMRAALRDVQPPPGLEAQLRAAVRGRSRATLPGVLASPWVLRALVPLAVLLAIVAVVLPRPAPAPATPAEAAPAAAPAELVRRALDRLYEHPAGSGVWHGSYTMRWIFADGSYADVDGDMWRDTVGGGHRIQLVHEEGGGPFEFQLGDGDGTLWYGTERRYAASLYPQISEQLPGRVEFAAPQADQDRLLAARLRSGAWDLPAAYLRQAARAEDLRSWGSRTADDGAQLAVISFRGVSPLGPPQGAGGSAAGVTVLLSIDRAGGGLYEIRELIGAETGEQSGRTVWQFHGGQWLQASAATADLFDVRRAFGTGSLYTQLRAGAAAPELPSVPVEVLVPLALTVEPGRGTLAPANVPPGISSAALIGSGVGDQTLLYLGEGRRIAIRTMSPARSAPTPFPRTSETEEVQLGAAMALLRPGPSQRYEVLFGDVAGARGTIYRARISAQGFSRDELLGVLGALALMSPDALRDQAPLFVGPPPQDAAAFDALLEALAASAAPETGATRAVALVSTRQRHDDLPLADPFHLAPYGGRPETVLVETWTRTAPGGGVETVTVTRSENGTEYARSYDGPSGAWQLDVPRSEVVAFRGRTPGASQDVARAIATQLLLCGGALVSANGGMRTVARTEEEWQAESCMLPRYPSLLSLQRGSLVQVRSGGVVSALEPGANEDTPFLADLADGPLTAAVTLADGGRVVQAAVRLAGAETALESWELVSEELVPADQVPGGLFSPEPPPAMLRLRLGGTDAPAPAAPASIGLPRAREALGGALFVPAPAAEPGASVSGTPEAVAGLTEVLSSNFEQGAIYGFLERYPDPFEGALHHGAALRLDFVAAGDQPDGAVRVPVYQGQAERFGSYLRAQARWASSRPLGLQVDGREVSGWLVQGYGGRSWTLFELDGTLVAAPADTPAQIELIGRLARA